MFKYPRTAHLEGSRLQAGDEDLAQKPFAGVRGKHIVAEEKLDGANCGISFTADGELRLQSRGHYLTGGPRERQFTLLKSWAATIAPVNGTFASQGGDSGGPVFSLDGDGVRAKGVLSSEKKDDNRYMYFQDFADITQGRNPGGDTAGWPSGITARTS